MKHKFELRIYTNKLANERPATLKGLTSLADACACAAALNNLRRGQPDTMIAVCLRTGKRDHDCLTVASPDRQDTYAELLARAEPVLKREVEKRKAHNARWKFLLGYKHGTITASEVFSIISSDETIKAAYFRNDFSPIKKFLAEKLPASTSHEP